jgi:hypothetical protein
VPFSFFLYDQLQLHIVTRQLKAGIMEQKIREASLALQLRGEQVSASANKHAATKEPIETMFLCVCIVRTDVTSKRVLSFIFRCRYQVAISEDSTLKRLCVYSSDFSGM